MQPIQEHLSDTQQVFDEAKTQLREQAEKQKTRAAIRLDDLSQALDQSAEELDSPALGRVSSGLASAAERLADADLERVYQRTRDLARDHAVGFLTGSFVLGLLIGRFFKAGDQPSSGGSHAQ